MNAQTPPALAEGQPLAAGAPGSPGAAVKVRFREHLLAAGLLAALALLVYGQLLWPGQAPYSKHSDFLAEHYSTKQALYDSLQRGEGVPFWRSDQFSGYGGLINPQAQYTYPLHGLFWVIEPLGAVGPTFWLHFLAAGLSYYLCVCAMGLGFWPRVLTGAAGMLSFKLILATYAGWLSILPSIVLFPLLLAAMIHLAERPTLWRGLLLALAGGLCLHVGHVQIVYYSLWFLLAYWVVRTVGRLRAAQKAAAFATTAYALMAGVLGLGLAAYLLAPLAAEAPLLSRGSSSYDFFLANHAIRPIHLLSLLHPEILGTPLDNSYGGIELWEDVAYVGLAPLALAVAGVVLGWRRRHTKFLAASFLAAILLAMDTPLLRLAYDYLPGMKLFRCPGRMLFVAGLFALLLAGIGAQELLERFARRRLARAILMTAALAIMAGEGFCYSHRYLQTLPQEQLRPPAELVRLLAGLDQPGRLAVVGRESFNYGWAAAAGAQMVNGYDSYNYQHYQEWLDRLQYQSPRPHPGPWADLPQAPPARLMSDLAVRYVASAKPLSTAGTPLVRIATLQDQPMFLLYQGLSRGRLYVYRNDAIKGRAWWEVPATAPTTQAVGEGQSVDLLRAGNGRLDLATHSPQAGRLILSEVYHPGWQARLDGVPLPLQQHEMIMAADLPAGDHRLELVFRPLCWPAALWVSLGALAVLGGLATWALVRGLRRGGKTIQTGRVTS